MINVNICPFWMFKNIFQSLSRIQKLDKDKDIIGKENIDQIDSWDAKILSDMLEK
jgi:hypothetical protein